MALLLGPDMGSRMVILPSGNPAAAKLGTVYANAGGTTLADILAYQPGNPTVPGAPIAGSVVTTDAYGLLPLFWWPDGVDKVWITVNGGPLVPINADYDARLDAVESGLGGKVSTSTLTAKGDLYAATGAGAVTRVGVGSDGQVLTADAASAAGVKWAAGGGGGAAQLDPNAAPFGLKLASLGQWEAQGTPIALGAGVCLLIRKWVPSSMSLTQLGTWMRVGGITSTGYNGLAIYDAAGNLLEQTADMSVQMALADQYVEGALGSTVSLTGNTSIYFGLLAHFSTNPTITGKAITNLVAINGARPSVFLTGQAAFPASVNVGAASINDAGYQVYAR